MKNPNVFRLALWLALVVLAAVLAFGCAAYRPTPRPISAETRAEIEAAAREMRAAAAHVVFPR